MDQIMDMLKNIQLEMQSQRETLRELQTHIPQEINNNINEKFKEIECNYKVLNTKLQEQEKRIDNLERQIRRKNIVIFGIEEKEMNYEGLEKEVLVSVSEIMSVNLAPMEKESLYRIGKKNSKPRPVKLTVTTLKKKTLILKNKKLLSDTQYYVTEDFPQKIIQERKVLNEKIKELRELGTNAMIRYNKIVLLDQKFDSQTNVTASPNTSISFSKQSNNRSHIKKNQVISYFKPKPYQ